MTSLHITKSDTGLLRNGLVYRALHISLSLCLALSTLFIVTPQPALAATGNPNLLVNGGFEQHPTAAAWSTLGSHQLPGDGAYGWHSNEPGHTTPAPAVNAGDLEVWGPGAFTPGVPGKVAYAPAEGSWLCEINNATDNQSIWQPLPPRRTLCITGRSNIGAVWVRIPCRSRLTAYRKQILRILRIQPT